MRLKDFYSARFPEHSPNIRIGMYLNAQGIEKPVQVENYSMSPQDRMKNYLSIGHDKDGDNELWLLIPGKGIQTAKGGDGVMHHVIWPHMNMTQVYRGRVERKDGVTTVSISPPFRSNPDTLNMLVPQLSSRFSADKVVVFN